MKLIDKDSLVSEIERVLDNAEEVNNTSYILLCNHLKDFIDTLETKEVDLEKEVDAEWNKCNPVDEGMGCEFANISIEQFYFIAKYFFELGLKIQKGE